MIKDDAGGLRVLNGMLIKVKVDTVSSELRYLYKLIQAAQRDECFQKHGHYYVNDHQFCIVDRIAVSMAEGLI